MRRTRCWILGGRAMVKVAMMAIVRIRIGIDVSFGYTPWWVVVVHISSHPSNRVSQTRRYPCFSIESVLPNLQNN